MSSLNAISKLNDSITIFRNVLRQPTFFYNAKTKESRATNADVTVYI